jgi:hypothetical protein
MMSAKASGKKVTPRRPYAAPYVTMILAAALATAAGCAGRKVLAPGETDAKLQGQWQTGCQSDSDQSQRTQLELDGEDLVQTASFFDDAHCTHLTFTLARAGNWRAGRAAEGTFTLRTTFLTASAEAANAFNQQGECGERGWAGGQAKEVSGKICAGESLGEAGHAGQMAIALQDGQLRFDDQTYTRLN